MASRAHAAFRTLLAVLVVGSATTAFAQEGENDSVTGNEQPPSPAAPEQPASPGAQAPASAPPAKSPPTQPPRTPPPAPWYPYPPPPQGWGPPGADRAPPASKPKPSAPPHIHDGFYLRLGLGIGLLRTASSFDGTVGSTPADRAIGDLTYSGHGLAVDGAIGGSPVPGFAFGYGFAWQIADDPTLTVENTLGADGESERDDPLGATIHGFFVDVFPDPKGNLEVGGLFGLATVGTGGGDNPSQGLAGAIWGGYGIWAGDQTSLVALLRLSLARTTSDYARSSAFGPSSTTSDVERVDTTFTVGVLTGLLVH